MAKIAGNPLINPLDEENEMPLLDSKKMEKLAYWFFRLNGFLTIENFVVHPNDGSDPHTDIDLLSVRFPYRKELPENPIPMKDYELFVRERDRIQIYLVEVKASKCRLNETWTNRDNMQQIMSAVGLFKEEEVNVVSEALCNQGFYKNNDFYVSLLCFGSETNPYLPIRTVPQIILNNALSFIYERFKKYPDQKVSHGQWDIFGRNLWHCAKKPCNFGEFRMKVIDKLLKSSAICDSHAKCSLCLWL
ncbi:MAG: hypothetical protein ABII09_00675 [Planctomycetota bacterium]